MIWLGDKLTEIVRKRGDTFRHAVGQHAQNQMVLFAHIKEGVLKNSINYRTSDGYWSGFGKQYGGETPPNDADVSQPKTDYVRVGSALVYAGWNEKHNGFASKTIDQLKADGSILKIGKEVYRLI